MFVLSSQRKRQKEKKREKASKKKRNREIRGSFFQKRVRTLLSQLVARAERGGLLRADRDRELDVLGPLDSPRDDGRGEGQAQESQDSLAAGDGASGALEELGLEARVAGAVGLTVHVPGPGGVLEVLRVLQFEFFRRGTERRRK